MGTQKSIRQIFVAPALFPNASCMPSAPPETCLEDHGTHTQKEWEEAQSEMLLLIEPEPNFSKPNDVVSFNSGHWGGATFHVRTIGLYVK